MRVVACGIAVRSSIGRYRRAARFSIRDDQYAFGKVNYHSDLESAEEIQRDFQKRTDSRSGLWPNVLALAFNKRSCYALYQDYRPEITGVHIDFDLEELIGEVFVDAVTSMMDKFLLERPLQRSVLLKLT